MKKKSVAELGHNDPLPVSSPILLKCQCLMNAEQNLVTFNPNDPQMELFQICITFSQIDHPKWLPLPLLKNSENIK